MANPKQTSFASGELAPPYHGGTTPERYATGLRTCRNAVIAKSGGAYSRPGFQFIGRTKDVSNNIRLIPFVFSGDSTYVLEFGVGYVRFIYQGRYLTRTLNSGGTPINNGAIQNGAGLFPANPSDTWQNPTQANPCKVTFDNRGGAFSEGDSALIFGVRGMGELNDRVFTVHNIALNPGDPLARFSQAELRYDGVLVDSTNYGSPVYTVHTIARICKIYEIATPYTSASLPDLRFVQSGDVITIVHPSFAPRELRRVSSSFADPNWTLSTISFGPSISAPAGEALSAGAGTSISMKVTAVHATTGEESLASAGVTGTPAAGGTYTWNAVSGAGWYNVYQLYNSAYSLIAIVTTNSWTVASGTPDFTKQPPASRAIFGADGSNDCPRAVAYYKQRLCFAGTNNSPETVWASELGRFKNFSLGIGEVNEDDAIIFTPAGRLVSRVEHLLDLKGLLVFTANSEIIAGANQDGIFAPPANVDTVSEHGSDVLAPLVVDGAPIFVQARGTVIRDMALDTQGPESDLTTYATHLLDGYTVVDWAYQKTPHRIIWLVRSDGALLSLTYVREKQLWAWARHDTPDDSDSILSGKFTQCCVVPEGDEDALYVTVWRGTKRFVERLSTRQVAKNDLPEVTYDPSSLGSIYSFWGMRDFIAADSAVTYDGRSPSTGNGTVTLSGGTNWTEDETFTLTGSVSVWIRFYPSDVGNEIHLYKLESTIVTTFPGLKYDIQETLRLEVVGYTSQEVITVRAKKTVPEWARNTTIQTWAKAVNEVFGLWHLNGKSVSVLGDGFVVASPNNDQYTAITVSNGKVTLPECYAVIHVGLPYVCDIEPLDIESMGGQSLASLKKHVSEVTLQVEKTRGVFVGPRVPEEDPLNEDLDPLYGMREVKVRDMGDDGSLPVLQTGKISVNIKSEWNSSGRFCIRQVDPLPMAILSISPTIAISEGE